ncbi:prepilin-type N-terminal cleavage/methylation domain-containing protein [uncultured Demequina sp.]|uniref:type IV pilus modification PilV family protein n=1 Tax=uncultured Demequina sp. TaxID=693499 RepID=UPI0025D24DCC|nr:prepilin-type N-terminal cleavage/methylation domain-containing protein [uncultured Demequina sp.]
MAHDEAQRTAAPRSSRRDEGFTLIEVTWALFLLGIVAMAVLALFIHGMRAGAHVQRDQAAVSLATTAMDNARAVTSGPVNAAGTSGAVKGRAYAAVESVWLEATARDASDTADMAMAWDPESGLTDADQWVPIRTTAVVDNQTYTIDTLIGTCWRLRAASTTEQSCVASDPAPGTDTYVEMHRIRVIVHWHEGDAANGDNFYRLSSLIDPSEDATWNTALTPFAYDDEFSVTAGASASFHAIVANDSVEYDATGTTSPIRELTQPAYGSVAINTALGVNGIVFTPPSDTSLSGVVTFTYKVEGTSGERSADPATVTVAILPSPRDDTIFVEPGTLTELDDDLLANDLGRDAIDGSRFTTIVPVWSTAVDMFSTEEVTPAMEAARTADAQDLVDNGIVSGAGDPVMFQAPSAANVSTTFYYYLVNDGPTSDDARYPSVSAASVTVTTQEKPLYTPDETVELDATDVDEWQEIDWRDATGNDDDVSIEIISVTGTGVTMDQVQLDGTSATTGEVLEFETLADTADIYELEYRVYSAGGRASTGTGTLTVHVVPFAPDLAAEVYEWPPTGSSREVTTFDLASQATPGTDVEISDLGSPTCGTLTLNGDGTIDFGSPSVGWGGATCTFTYLVQTTATSPALESQAPGTVTITVRNGRP